MDNLDIALRLGAAALAGSALGLNRDLHGKPTGVRTLGLVGIGSALAVLAISGGASAGVIFRNNEGQHVHGLTTAACVWLTACFGVACAVAEWRIVLIGAPLVFVILVFGGRFEKAVHRCWPKSETPDTN
jgi:putative Mg2+ transporter-C (MgtC) family protein